MKPFNLEQAKAGAPVQTNCGQPVRILCFDKKGDNSQIAGLIQLGDNDLLDAWNLAGVSWRSSVYDLVMSPVKKEGWVNIYKGWGEKLLITGQSVFDTKDKAIKTKAFGKVYLDTIKIEWEE